MLSAYWGDPAGLRARSRSAAVSRLLQRFNDWFDHQADRYGNVIAWALHHREWMAADRGGRRFVGALVLQVTVGGSSFLPTLRLRDASPIDVRTPSVGEPRVRAAEGREGAPSWRAPCPRPRRPTARERRAAGASTSTSASSTQRKRTPIEIADGAARADEPAGRRRVRGARRPEQGAQQAGADPVLRARFAQAAWRSPTTSWTRCAQVPGAVDVGLSEQEPKDELQDRARPRPGQLRSASRSTMRRRRCAWPSPASRSATGSIRRARRATSRCACIPTTASTPATSSACRSRWRGSNMMVPLDQIATITMGKGPAQIQHLDGKRTVAVSANAQGRALGRGHRRRA